MILQVPHLFRRKATQSAPLNPILEGTKYVHGIFHCYSNFVRTNSLDKDQASA